MLYPVGLDRFAAAYPERIFDVGIAEQHAVTSAAGLAMGGLHPVVAIYATFLNRAFDQVLMDVALHKCGVTFVLDRAGVTGTDGASHNGMWDMSILQVVPGLRIAAPRDGARVRELLREAVDVNDAPDRACGCPRARRPTTSPRSTTPVAATCWYAAAARTCSSSASARWPPSRSRSPSGSRRRASASPWSTRAGSSRSTRRWSASPATTGSWSSIEDNGRVGGVGATLLQLLSDEGVTTPFSLHGIPQEFLQHAERQAILDRIGLNAQTIARGMVERLAAEGHEPLPITEQRHQRLAGTTGGSACRHSGRGFRPCRHPSRRPRTCSSTRGRSRKLTGWRIASVDGWIEGHGGDRVVAQPLVRRRGRVAAWMRRKRGRRRSPSRTP